MNPKPKGFLADREFNYTFRNPNGELNRCGAWSLQGLKVQLNKYRKEYLNHFVACLGEVELWSMSIQEFDDLRKIHWRKREVHLRMLAKQAEIERVKIGMANMRKLEDELAEIKRELGRM